MEKRAAAPRKPGSRDGSFPSPSPSLPTFPSPSPSLPTFPSPPSSSASMRTDALPDALPRPSSSSSTHSNSRPHSPTTLPPIVSPSSASHSPVGSPLTKKRSLTSQQDTFLTSLRGASGISSYTDAVEDVNENHNHADGLSNQILDYVNGESNATENGNGTDTERTHNAEELARIDIEQAARRTELDSYMAELHSKKDVVVFPKHFSELLETIESDQAAITNFWAKFMVDPQIDNPWLEDEQLAKGLERIRKLDIILAKKTKQAREMQKAMQPNKPTKEDAKQDKDKAKHIPAPPQLTQVDEKRIEALLDEETSPAPQVELQTPFDELESLYEVDVKLAQIIDVSEWEEKGLAHLRPTSASSRASYASYASRSSQVSRTSYLSLGSHTSLTEMEKEEEAREAADRARMLEIDARLRELTSNHAGDAEGAAQAKAPPDEIRELVRMYSAPRIPHALA